MALNCLMVLIVLFKLINASLDWDIAQNPALDQSLYEEVLDPELCQEQITHLRRLGNAMLRLRFLDAGIRFPRGFLQGNTLDMGNYHQCLGIHEEIEDSVIEGKYCTIRGPLSQNFESLVKALPSELDPDMQLSEELLRSFEENDRIKQSLVYAGLEANVSRSIPENPLTGTVFNLAVCVPKPCTTLEGMRGLLVNLNASGLNFHETFCRLNNDKPWVAADYIAIAVFSLIGLLTLLSTSYDIWHNFIQKKDPKTASSICKSFSIYTNARRLTTFTSNPNNLESADGIRALAMTWVVVGHTFGTQPAIMNNFDVLTWIVDFRSLWLTAAPYTVDTFFMLSGLLVVYTTVGKLSGPKLLKNLHLFYLHRLLRMFPVLAAIVLLQASVLNRISDGPNWTTVARHTNRCRTYWWTTLLYVQNFVNYDEMCISHSWYLAIDMQLYIVSPLVLFWVLSGKRNVAWIGLTAGLLVSLAGGAIYSFIWQFPGWTLAPSRPGGASGSDYMFYYYFHTLPRASPFFVGMVFGYLLHLWKGKQVQLPIPVAILLWVCTVTITSSTMYVTHLMKAFATWDNWLVDDLVNSFARPLWAMAVGYIIFACQHGYGGPINWLLSLQIWKLLSRISYAIYLFHYPIQFVISGSVLAPIYFTEASVLYEFLSQMVISYAVAFVVTLVIDSPFSTIFKLLLGEGPKKPKKEVADKE